MGEILCVVLTLFKEVCVDEPQQEQAAERSASTGAQHPQPGLHPPPTPFPLKHSTDERVSGKSHSTVSLPWKGPCEKGPEKIKSTKECERCVSQPQWDP